jgi:hypothetical protein
MREQIREIMRRRLVEPLAGELAIPDALLRVEILVALAIGVSLTRASGTLPTLAAAPLEDVLAALEPLAGALQQTAAP